MLSRSYGVAVSILGASVGLALMYGDSSTRVLDSDSASLIRGGCVVQVNRSCGPIITVPGCKDNTCEDFDDDPNTDPTCGMQRTAVQKTAIATFRDCTGDENGSNDCPPANQPCSSSKPCVSTCTWREIDDKWICDNAAGDETYGDWQQGGTPGGGTCPPGGPITRGRDHQADPVARTASRGTSLFQ
jgi:hypothetical protein